MNKNTKRKRQVGWEPIKRAITFHGGQAAMAKSIKCSQASVSYWLTGVRKPSPLNAKRIEKSTNGLVRARELIPEVFD